MNRACFSIGLLLLLALPLVGVHVCAQNTNLKFKHLSIDDGLSHHRVNCMVQDKQGFLWFGTNEGLNKYDGSKFTVYLYSNTDSNSLSNNHIGQNNLIEDNNGDIWVGTRNGLNRLNKRTNKFTRYFGDGGELTNSSILCIYKDRRGNLWVGTYNGLNFFDAKLNRFYKYEQNPAIYLPEEFITCCTEDRYGNIVYGTKNGVMVFDPHRQKFLKHPLLSKNKILSNSRVTDLMFDTENNLWVSTYYNGLFCLQNNRQLVHYPANNKQTGLYCNTISFIYTDSHSNLWLGTDGNGHYLFNKTTQRFLNLTHNDNDHSTIASNAGNCAFEDPGGTLWFCTSNGISYTDHSKKFTLYQKNTSEKSGLTNNNVSSFARDSKGNFWIGTDGGGLCLFNRETGSITPYRFNNRLSSLKVVDLAADNLGNLWVATWGGGVNQINLATNKINHYLPKPGNPKSLLVPDVMCILCDHNENIWAGTFGGGIAIFDKQEGNFVPIPPPPGITTTYIYSLKNDSRGNLWIGDVAGRVISISYSNNKKISPENIKFSKNSRSQGTGSGQAKVFLEDSLKNLWIGTNDGLILFDPVKDTSITFRKENGLPGNTVEGILEDKKTNLWLSTPKGLSMFNRQNKTFTNYTLKEGLLSTPFSFHACYKDYDGTMFFGGINGFSVFHPDSIKNNPFIPPVVITDLQLFRKTINIGDKHQGRVILPAPVSETSQIKLYYNENMISFNYVALNYILPEKNQYAYMLEGFDQAFRYVGNEQLATYTNLDPGEYVFKAIASNNDGVWNTTGSSVKIIIMPPWWKTWWAYTFYIATTLVVLYFIRKISLTNVRLRHQFEIERIELEKKRELNQLKLDFFANISHEFKTPLTLLIGPLEKTLSTKWDNDIAMIPLEHCKLMARNTRHLSRLINQLLDMNKLEDGRMQLQVCKDDLWGYIRNIALTFTPLAEQRNITYLIDIKEQSSICWFDADKIEKIIENLLSNAFKFTPPCGKVKISVKTQKNIATITVEDSGIGIAAEHLPHIFDRFYQAGRNSGTLQQGTGIGLALVKSLLDLHHGSITVESTANKGTTFIVTVPVGREHYSNNETYTNETQNRPGHPNELVAPSPENFEPSAGEQPESPNTQLPLLLIIDDNDDVRLYLKDIFKENFRVKTAKDGKEGLEKASELFPDIILCDVMMPFMDGIEFCRRLKTDEKICHIPVVLLTARSSDEYKLKGYETGADDYITKPFSPSLLEMRVKNLINSRKKLREQFVHTRLGNIKEALPTNADEKFLTRAIQTVEKHFSNEDFDAETLSKEMGMSRSVLYLKFRALTNQTVNEFIKTFRLKKASMMLLEKNTPVNEIAYKVGFKNISQFTRDFKEFFGVPPSKYTQSNP